MCRSIKQLRGSTPPTDEEIEAAARQFVRKVSGYQQPSRANEAALEQAVVEIAASAKRLLDSLVARSMSRWFTTGVEYSRQCRSSISKSIRVKRLI